MFIEKTAEELYNFGAQMAQKDARDFLQKKASTSGIEETPEYESLLHKTATAIFEEAKKDPTLLATLAKKYIG